MRGMKLKVSKPEGSVGHRERERGGRINVFCICVHLLIGKMAIQRLAKLG